MSAAAVPAALAKPKGEAVVQEETIPQVTSPVTLLVSLNKQRMWVYDANGLVTSSRVSTGMAGFDTPKGVYSIIEKKVEHSSNIYEGASMPYMQRLLQTGIAMHGGVVPGYPASHGCIRLPFSFAPKLFDMTTMNERVVVQPEVMAPVSIEHEALFTALPAGTLEAPVGYVQKTNATQDDINKAVGNGSVTETVRTKAIVLKERMAERERLEAAIDKAKDSVPAAEAAIPAAMKAAEDARIDLKKAKAEAWRLDKAADKAVSVKERAADKLKSLTRQIERKQARMLSTELEEMRKAQAEIEASIAALATAADQAKADAKAAETAADDAAKKVSAADKARVDAKKALATARASVGEAEKALAKFDRQETKRDEVVSVLVSGKTGKISIRQGWEMVAEAPITIKNPEMELGTYLFTATSWKDETQTALKWQVTAAGPEDGGDAVLETASYETSTKKSRKEREREKERLASLPPPTTDANKAAAVLSRLEIPAEMRMKVAEVMKPGSTLIVSDFDMARSETRPGTDFVVQTPEVIAKITAPPPKKREELDDDDEYEGGWFFFSPKPKKKPQAASFDQKKRYGSRKYYGSQPY